MTKVSENLFQGDSDSQENPKVVVLCHSNQKISQEVFFKNETLKNLKFKSYFSKHDKSEEYKLNYISLYQNLHEDILIFNKELNHYNQENEKYFLELTSKVETLIQTKFPSIYI